LGLGVSLALPARAAGLPEAPPTLTLDQALTRALANNPQLRAARNEEKRAEAEATQARFYPLRNLNANLGYAGSIPPQPGLNPTTAGAYLTFNLGDLLSTPAAMQGAQARVESAKEAVRATELQVVANTTAAYAAWSTQQKLLALKQEAIKASQSDVVVVQRLFGRGTATIGDVMKARLAVSQTQVDLVQAEGEYDKAWAVLVQQMGDTSWLNRAKP
jgi:outer membrane protein TolC